MRLPRAPLLLLAFPAAGGILAAAVLPSAAALCLGIAGLLSAVFLKKKRDLSALLAVASLFVLSHGLAVLERDSAPRWQELRDGLRPFAEVTGHVRNITPPRRGGRALWNYELRATSITTGGETHRGHWRILLSCPDRSLGFGDRVRARGRYELPAPARNPGAFDRRGWLLDQGYSALLVTRGEVQRQTIANQHSPAARLLAALGTQVASLRQWLAATVTRGIADDPVAAAVVRAVVLGDRGGLPDELEKTFRLSGTMHLFAVSGLHVAMVAGLLLATGKLLRLPGWVAMPLVLAGLVLYVMATGLRPSACRAAVMVIAYWAALLFDRSPSLLNTLGLAALLLLGLNTWDLFSVGFQLSFAVMLGIGLLGAPLRDHLAERVAPDPFLPRTLLTPSQRLFWKVRSTISTNLSISTGAWAGSLVPVALYFGLVTPVVVPANLALIFPAFLILWMAGLATVAGALGLGWLVITINHANWLVVKTVTALAALFAAVPGGHLHLAQGWDFLSRPGTLAEVTIFEIPGGGGAAHIDLGRSHWLVDTGSADSFHYTVLPQIQNQGTGDLDGVFLTHGGSSHAGGLPAIARLMPQTRIWRNATPSSSPVEARITAAAGGRPIPLAAGDLVPLVDGNEDGTDGARIEVLYPPAAAHRPRLADDGCLVLRLHVGDQRILFTADAGLSAEHWLLEHGTDLRADLLVMGRHTNDFCGDLSFLRAVDPQAIVASNANFPEGEAIPPAWARRVKEAGFLLLDQRETGALSVRIGPGGLFCRTTLDHRSFHFPSPRSLK